MEVFKSNASLHLCTCWTPCNANTYCTLFNHDRTITIIFCPMKLFLKAVQWMFTSIPFLCATLRLLFPNWTSRTVWFRELFQPLRWCCVDCVIYHERGVHEEQKRYVCGANKQFESDLVRWSLLLLAATVRSFGHMPCRISDRNKMVLWPGCGGRAGFSLHTKNVRSVRFVVKRRRCCCNLSSGVALIAWFTTNGVCTKNKKYVYVARTSNKRVLSLGDLYCCLLPWCEALRTCRAGFLIATEEEDCIVCNVFTPTRKTLDF